jgi:hypothetical protein
MAMAPLHPALIRSDRGRHGSAPPSQPRRRPAERSLRDGMAPPEVAAAPGGRSAVRALRPQQTEVTALCDDVVAAGALEFPADRSEVGLHGVAGDVQLLADLGEGEVGRQ